VRGWVLYIHLNFGCGGEQLRKLGKEELGISKGVKWWLYNGNKIDEREMGNRVWASRCELWGSLGHACTTLNGSVASSSRVS